MITWEFLETKVDVALLHVGSPENGIKIQAGRFQLAGGADSNNLGEIIGLCPLCRKIANEGMKQWRENQQTTGGGMGGDRDLSATSRRHQRTLYALRPAVLCLVREYCHSPCDDNNANARSLFIASLRSIEVNLNEQQQLQVDKQRTWVLDQQRNIDHAKMLRAQQHQLQLKSMQIESTTMEQQYKKKDDLSRVPDRDLKRALKALQKKIMKKSPFRPGDRVQMYWEDERQYFSGHIAAGGKAGKIVNGHRCWMVIYDDGDTAYERETSLEKEEPSLPVPTTLNDGTGTTAMIVAAHNGTTTTTSTTATPPTTTTNATSSSSSSLPSNHNNNVRVWCKEYRLNFHYPRTTLGPICTTLGPI